MRVLYIIHITLIFTFVSTAQTNQLIVKLKKQYVENSKKETKSDIKVYDKVSSINKKYNVLSTRKLSSGKLSSQLLYTVSFPADINLKDVILEYQLSNEVEYVEIDQIGEGYGIKPNDEFYSNQWAMNNDGSFTLSKSKSGADIEMENAWEIEQGDSNIVVCVIDGGTKLDHPELAGRIWTNYDEIPNNGMDDDGNGYVDDYRGWDFVNTDNDPTDDYGHGANVSSIIAANANNGIGFAGVDWNCKLMVLKGLNNKNIGSYSIWIEAVYYAVDNGANVLNLSLGGTSPSMMFEEAINYALQNNVVVVAAMGNSNSNITAYPASYTGVIAVGCTGANDKRTINFAGNPNTGSNYGSHISVVAPGDYIYGINHKNDTKYSVYWSGTSQAAPHVAGLASLLLAQDPSRTPDQIKTIIEATAEDQVGSTSEDTPGWDQYYGYGRINAYKALSYSTTGLNRYEESNLSVYPNPSSGNFRITFPNSELRSISMINEVGQLIYQKEIITSTFEMNENIVSGIYFLLAQTGVQMESNKLIIQK